MRRMLAVALVTLAAAACGGTSGGSSMLAGFAGYKWSVVAISRDGRSIVRSGIDLGIPRGSATVVTGPNGVGKSTLALTPARLVVKPSPVTR